MILILIMAFTFYASLSIFAVEFIPALIGFAAAVNAFFVAVVICFIYEKATGISLITGKVTDEELAEQVKAGKGKGENPSSPRPPSPNR